MNMVQLENIVKILHENQYDKTGTEYYKHPIWVKNNLPSWASADLQFAALFHDALEDTDISELKLKILGASERALYIINICTHKKTESYSQYIQRIIDTYDIDIITLKLTDMKHNLMENRLSMLDKKTKQRLLKKYIAHQITLKAALYKCELQLHKKCLILSDFLTDNYYCVTFEEFSELSGIERYIRIYNYLEKLIDTQFDLDCDLCKYFTARFQYAEDVGDTCNRYPCGLSNTEIILSGY